MTKILVLGLDGVSRSVLNKMAQRDAIPNISNVLESSPVVTSRTTIPSLTCPALPSLYTGQNPSEFGVFDFIKPDGSFVNITDIDVPKVWDYLNEEGHQAMIAGMRTTHPAPDISGIFISGVLSIEDEPDYVSPESYREQAQTFNTAGSDITHLINKDDREGIRDALIEQSEQQTNVLLDILSEENQNLDFGLLWLSAPDSAQHHLWGHDDLLTEFFHSFDKDISRILNFASEHGYNIILVSDHGFGPAPEYFFHLNEWLYREGYLYVQGSQFGKPFVNLGYSMAEKYTSDWLKRAILSITESVGDIIPNTVSVDSDAEAKTSEETVVSPMSNLPGINWGETEAHLSTRKGWGINLCPSNISRCIDLVRQEIIEKIQNVTAPNGNPAVENAWSGQDFYKGKYSKQVPDIVLLMDDEVRARPSITGKLFTTAQRTERTLGDHTSAREGFLSATGPVFNDGTLDLDPVEIYDVLPTILHAFDIPIPKSTDGRVLTELFATGSDPAMRGVEEQEYDIEIGQPMDEYGQGQGVEDRLKELGYME
jgi:predicted AlkP superfamily phosphohydrolase/phosphomutase